MFSVIYQARLIIAAQNNNQNNLFKNFVDRGFYKTSFFFMNSEKMCLFK